MIIVDTVITEKTVKKEINTVLKRRQIATAIYDERWRESSSTVQYPESTSVLRNAGVKKKEKFVIYAKQTFSC